MVYRNIKTGAEIITNSQIIAPDYVLVNGLGELAAKNGVKFEKLHEPEHEEEPVKKDPPKVPATKSKSAPKKRGARK